MTPTWRVAFDASSALAFSTHQDTPITLYDEVTEREACTRDTPATLRERFPPEALYALRARPVALVGDYVTIERFESRMCQGGAHPDNIHELRTYLLPDASRPVPLSSIFDTSEIQAAIARDAFFTKLIQYTRTRDPSLLGDEDEAPCRFEVAVPDASTTSWAFAHVDDEHTQIDVVLLVDNPVHMCGGVDVRRTITLPVPDTLRQMLSSHQHHHFFSSPDTEARP